MRAYKTTIKMYDEDIWVNTETREGYDRIIERINPLLCKWASRTYMPGHSFEDIKQELTIIIIEGINAFDPSKKVKLSTFLHTHLRNKLVSKIKSFNKLSNDACSLHDDIAGDICECGGKIEHKVVVGYAGIREDKWICKSCDLTFNSNLRKSRGEITFSSMPKIDISSGEEYLDFENMLGESDSLYSDDKNSFDKTDLTLMLSRLKGKLDEKTYSILRMVCLEGYSFKDAAEKVGLTSWAASVRLKKLAKSKIMTDILDNYIV
jgi:RNA polymerase sigma factor (sigma-70 family)